MAQLINPDKRILVIGSLNANPADRAISRENIHTMQLIDEELNIYPVKYFNGWGELGLSSMAYNENDRTVIYIASSSDVYKFYLAENRYEKLNIPNLTDIHEISMIGNNIWISNTKHDEIVSYDIEANKISARINLSDFASGSSDEGVVGDDVEVVDKFHCNLIFEGYEGDVYILVHHTSGRQLIKRIAQKFIKSQGNGGVVNITKNKRYPLNFKAPHSVRRINNQYWVFDSGHFELKIFDKNWNFLRTLDTKGFGRGGDIDVDRSIYYCGISETRKRYLGLFPGGEAVPNMVQAFSVNNYKLLGSIKIPAVEQINNVYCIEKNIADMLMNFN